MEAIDFTLYDQTGNQVSLSSYRKKWIVLYFYPKNTASFAQEMLQAFDRSKGRFRHRGARIILINPEPVSSNFALPYRDFPILSDPGKDVIKEYNLIIEREIEGKLYQTIVPTLFLISPDFEIVRKWDNVRDSSVIEEVLKTIDLLKNH